MKFIGLALPTAGLAVFVSVVSQAEVRDRAAYSKQSLQAKIEYCETCHGLSGEGYRGFIPMPRLAGQQPEYFVNQLRAFVERKRDNKYMYLVARSLNPAILSALAAHFRDLDTKPLGGAPRGLVAAGKQIYEEGVPESNVPACMACHGPEAEGRGEIPRLAGQLYDYTTNQLLSWSKKKESPLMGLIAHNLTKSQIAALAAYVSYQQ